MNGVVLLCGLLLTSPPEAAQTVSDRELLERAETEFRAGREARDDPSQARDHFARAADCYETLRQRGYRSTALFLNQGNANLLAGDLPRAILAYHRGVRLAQMDMSPRYNLMAARDEVAYPTTGGLRRPPDVSWRDLLPGLGSEWFWKFALLSYLGFWNTFLIWLFVRSKWWLGGAATLLLMSLSAAAFLIVDVRRSDGEARHPLVVVARDGVTLRTGNGDSYPRRLDTVLNRGVEARQLFARGGWLQIELAGGAVGWVRRADVLTDND